MLFTLLLLRSLLKFPERPRGTLGGVVHSLFKGGECTSILKVDFLRTDVAATVAAAVAATVAVVVVVVVAEAAAVAVEVVVAPVEEVYPLEQLPYDAALLYRARPHPLIGDQVVQGALAQLHG